jgi:hypothetical protein
MSKFRLWYLDNQIEITWFLIGFLVTGAISDFGQGNWQGVIINLSLAFVNYILNKRT